MTIDIADTELVDDLIAALEALTQHLARENTILERHDASELAPLHTEKQRLTEDYASIMADIRVQPQLVTNAPADIQARLRGAGERFQAVMQEHSRRVTSLKKVTEGIIRVVCDQVDARNRPLDAYSGQKTVAPRRTTAPTSIAFNQRV